MSSASSRGAVSSASSRGAVSDCRALVTQSRAVIFGTEAAQIHLVDPFCSVFVSREVEWGRVGSGRVASCRVASCRVASRRAASCRVACPRILGAVAHSLTARELECHAPVLHAVPCCSCNAMLPCCTRCHAAPAAPCSRAARGAPADQRAARAFAG